MTDLSTSVPLTRTPRPTKTAIVTKLLARPRGASLGDIIAVTSWQAHTVRAFLTGLRKKGVALEREQRRDGVTAYRIVKLVPVTAMVAAEAAGE